MSTKMQPAPETDAEEEARESARLALDEIQDKLNEARTIQQRMLAILDELPAIGKDQRNTQQDFMFRGHDDILNALNPLLAKHGVFIVPNVIERTADKRATSRGSIMYEVNLHIEFTFWGADGSKLTASTWGEGTDMGDKATNKAMTMAFKNVLNQAFSISTQEMSYADSDASSPEETVVQQQRVDPEASKKVSRRRRISQLLASLDEKTGNDKGAWGRLVEQEVLRMWGVPYSDLTLNDLDEVGKTLKVQLDSEEITELPEQLNFVVPF